MTKIDLIKNVVSGKNLHESEEFIKGYILDILSENTEIARKVDILEALLELNEKQEAIAEALNKVKKAVKETDDSEDDDDDSEDDEDDDDSDDEDELEEKKSKKK